jgi:hypothetical protein
MNEEAQNDIMTWLGAIEIPPEYKRGFVLPNGTRYSGFLTVGALVRSLLSEAREAHKKVDALQVDKHLLWKSLHEIRGTVRDAIGEEE